MSHLVVPKVTCVEDKGSFGRFVAEPLEKGMGITLGNSLRRVLLGQLQGAAVTRVKIEGIHHEFSTIPSVKEDTTEFLLNVKALRLKAVAGRPGKLTLEVEGERRVYASDIKPSAEFEVVNPELYLAALDSADARLYVEFDVELSKGYREAESSSNLPEGVMPVDAIFTPTRKVNYVVEPVHIGQETSRERLTMEVWTDGTTTAAEAVSQGAELLTEQLAPFVSYSLVAPAEQEENLLSIPAELSNMPVDQLNLSVRTLNSLRRGGITTVGEIVGKGEKGLMSLRNFGQKSKQEVEERLTSLGLSLTPQVKTGEEEAAEPEPAEKTSD